jgi:thioredoxin 1
MATVQLTAENFEATISQEGIVLIDFWADWCGPCKMFAPVYESSSEAHPAITFAKVDTEAEQMLAAQCGIQSIPTIMMFRDGILLFNQSGALPGHVLEDIIGKAEALDMDAVRAEIAEQEQND